MNALVRLLALLDRIDRRVIYLFVFVSLSVPLLLGITLPPAEMKSVESVFNRIQSHEPTPGKIVLVSADWGPGTKAENLPQTAVAIEHLMRRRIPFALTTLYVLGSPFLDDIPKDIASRLEEEYPGEKWEYGKDWVNLGYRPGYGQFVLKLGRAEDFHVTLRSDAYGTPLKDIPVMKDIHSKEDIAFVLEFTGLTGALAAWIQFFQGPPLAHGCTSITIPDAYIFLVSGQLDGLFEGIAGAAWYDKLMSDMYPKREQVTDAMIINSGLAFAHVIIIAFIILGNISLLVKVLSGEKE